MASYSVPGGENGSGRSSDGNGSGNGDSETHIVHSPTNMHSLNEGNNSLDMAGRARALQEPLKPSLSPSQRSTSPSVRKLTSTTGLGKKRRPPSSSRSSPSPLGPKCIRSDARSSVDAAPPLRPPEPSREEVASILSQMQFPSTAGQCDKTQGTSFAMSFPPIVAPYDSSRAAEEGSAVTTGATPSSSSMTMAGLPRPLPSANSTASGDPSVRFSDGNGNSVVEQQSQEFGHAGNHQQCVHLQWGLQQQMAAQQLWQVQMQQAPQVQSQVPPSQVPQAQGPLAQQSLQGQTEVLQMQQATLGAQMQQQMPLNAQMQQQMPQMQHLPQMPQMQQAPQIAQVQQAQAPQAHMQQVSHFQQMPQMQQCGPQAQHAPQMQQPPALQAQMQMQQLPQAHMQQALQAQMQMQQQQQMISQQQGAPGAMPMPLYQAPQALRGQGRMLNLWDPSLSLPIGPGSADSEFAMSNENYQRILALNGPLAGIGSMSNGDMRGGSGGGLMNMPMASMHGHSSTSSSPLGANPYGPAASNPSSSSLGGLNMAAYGPGTGAPPPPVNFAAPPPLPPPVASAGALVRRRAGRWTIEEETYARAIIAHFQTGKIDLEDGTTLRYVLAAALSCGPMRITKKFAGIGKRVYKSSEFCLVSRAEKVETARELNALRWAYLRSVEDELQSPHAPSSISPPPSALLAPPSMAPPLQPPPAPPPSSQFAALAPAPAPAPVLAPTPAPTPVPAPVASSLPSPSLAMPSLSSSSSTSPPPSDAHQELEEAVDKVDLLQDGAPPSEDPQTQQVEGS